MSSPLPGNETVRQRLASLAALERLHPCLLFEGPQGVGKAAAATWLAQVVNCDEQPLANASDDALPQPCGRCWACRNIVKHEHPDVIRVGLDPERTAPIISADQARQIISRLRVRPYQARRRFVIIDPADAMTVSAANAMLKTFEEPPSSTVFILITAARHKLLSTVQSRSQRVRFGPTPLDQLTPWLVQQGVDDAATIARLSDGCPGRALELAQGEAQARRDARDALLDAVGGDIHGVFEYTTRLVRGNRVAWTLRVDRTLDELGRLIRDALVLDSGAQIPLYNDDRDDVIASWAAALGPSGVARLGGAVDTARGDLAAYVNPRLLLDTLLMRVVTELGQARRLGRRSGAD